MDLSLNGRRAVICGSTQGIGLGSARELALLGADCILMARDGTRLEACARELPRQDGQSHSFCVADFSDPTEVGNAINSVLSQGPVHILINNTGGPAPGPITAAKSGDFSAAFTQHVVNNQTLATAVLPGMKEAGYGRIINVISTSVRIPETGRLDSLIRSIATDSATSEDVIRKRMSAEVPTGRFGKVAEIAALAAFLASPAAAYINGTSIPVDGGRTGSI
ncbi:MAG: SDR family oxidoreductase [Chitinophagaceae bacterium]|nr:SDR family oxidoreductase [Chitinophagaceae bacterium]